jgi:uncharacterized membrane protein
MLELLTLAASLGSGLAAGFFFAFSFCVMQALGKIPASQGIAAMQSINVVVIKRLTVGGWPLHASMRSRAIGTSMCGNS